MVHAILSDIHANATALTRALAEARRLGAGRVVCLGDVVGYGPQPAECVDTLRDTGAETIAGNHDDAVSGRLDPADFIDLAADAVSRHRDALSPNQRTWLRNLPYTLRHDSFAAAHGDFTDPPAFNYTDSPDTAAAAFAATTEPLLFVGHTHLPALYVIGASNRVHALDPVDFTLEDGKRYLVNPGSVGYPRDANGTCLSSFVLYDDAAKTVTFHYLPFAVSSVMQRGAAPRRRRSHWVLAACAAAAAAGFAVALYCGDSSPASANATTPENSATNAVGVIAEKELTLADGARIRPNLILEKDSPPAILWTRYYAADGSAIKADVKSFKQRATGALPKPPAGAVRVKLEIVAAQPGQRPIVKSFEPDAVKSP